MADKKRYRLFVTDEEQGSEVHTSDFNGPSEADAAFADMLDSVSTHEDNQYGTVGGTFTFHVTAVRLNEQEGLWQRMAHVLERGNIPVEDGGFQEDS